MTDNVTETMALGVITLRCGTAFECHPIEERGRTEVGFQTRPVGHGRAVCSCYFPMYRRFGPLLGSDVDAGRRRARDG